ncbi:unnamed protein product [Dicrocoelium dendriticum]|nr:unnamed protein product [Dicrocoelium dendriticum]
MSSDASPRTPNDFESDIDFSGFSVSSDLDLDFGFRGNGKPSGLTEKGPKHEASSGRNPESLLVLTAKATALHFPFEVVESSPLVIPEELQRLIAFHSFPTDEDDIWLYSCLSSGGSYEFDQGEALWADKAVRDCVQIGFFLSATVLTSLLIAPASQNHLNADRDAAFATTTCAAAVTSASHQGVSGWDPALDTRRLPPNSESNLGTDGVAADSNHVFGFNIEPGYPAHRVSITFDRNRITSCSCTCTFDVDDGCANITSPRNLPEDKASRGLDCGLSDFPNPAAAQTSGTFSYQPMNSSDPNTAQRRGLPRINSGLGLFPNANPGNSRLGPTVPSLLPRRGVRGVASDQRNRNEPSLCSLFNSLFGAYHNSSHDLAGATGANVTPPGTWCSHVVAACLMRIRQPGKVLLRAPISESLSRLTKDDLQKFAQNLICHVGPKKILPAAQHILDQLLASTDNPIKSSLGAPDPTAGGAIGDAAAWCFDGAVLEEKLRVTLQRFWSSKPSVIYSDICSLNSDSPLDVEKFHCVLHSLRGNDPRGVWDLLSIIGDMMRRQDNNGVLLLEIVTRCIIDMQELMTWWCVAKTKNSVITKGMPICQRQTQYAALWMCEELVHLWHLACLSPDLRPQSHSFGVDRIPSGSSCASASSKTTTGSGSHPSSSDCWLLQQLSRRLRAFHLFALEQAGFQPQNLRPNADVRSSPPGASASAVTKQGLSTVDYERFSGFKPALAACYIRWPSGFPPTHSLSWEEFRACIPSFTGARVSLPQSDGAPDSTDHVVTSACINWMRTITTLKRLQFELHHTTDEPSDHPAAHVFEDLPLPEDEAQLAFARFQALDAHGHTKQSLVWARYLALRLLYLSVDFVADSEAAAFRVIGSHRLAGSNGALTTKSLESAIDIRPQETGNTKRPKKHTTAAVTAGISAVGDTPVLQTCAESKSMAFSDVLPDEPTDEAVEWTTKVSQLLDQIRCLMECLTRGYNDSVCNPSSISAANRITTSGRTLLSFRGPDPNSFNVHLDDMASPVARQTIRHSFAPIGDEWTCIDVELAFRLGFYGLSLPRPPTTSPILEVRVFDQEVALVSRMCRLPIHVACPHVLQSIRQEASILARNLSTYQTDILVPYNLASYIFHVLVGTHPTLEVLVNLTDPINLLRRSDNAPTAENVGEVQNTTLSTTHQRSATSDDANPNERGQVNSDVELSNRCPVLATGAILAGCGLPLVVSSHYCRNKSELNTVMRSSYLRALDLSTLENALWLDADLGFNTVLSVIGTRSRVPQAEFPYFIEGQWAQLDALMAYLFRHYRDDVEKLDHLLTRLLHRYYNPHFKVPPLWACLSLSPGELMRFNQFPNLPSHPPEAEEAGDNLAATTQSLPASSIAVSSVLPLTSDQSSLTPAQTCSAMDTSSVPPRVSGATEHSDAPHPDATRTATVDAESTAPAAKSDHAVDSNRTDSIETFSSDLRTTSQPVECSLVLYDPTSASEDTDTLSDSKMLSERLRCATLRDPRRRGRHSVGMASVDTSAPETTSSDNSPAASRRFPFYGYPADSVSVVSDTAEYHAQCLPRRSSFTTADVASPQTSAASTPNPRDARSELPEGSSLVCARNARKRIGHAAIHTTSLLSSEDDDLIPCRPDPPPQEGIAILSPAVSESCLDSVHAGSPTANAVVTPVLAESQAHPLASNTQTTSQEASSVLWPYGLKRPPPQQLSDPMAFHMFQLAKSVRKLAGGPTASGSVFVPEPEAHGGIVHPNLQLVAFQIGLYGLGMYNQLHSSWRSRTYSRNGGWVSQQVFELGIPAACILYHSWQHHFTAAELAGIAFQLSRENYRPLVDVAAELCLASLSFCTTLRPQEIYRALGQCEEHSTSVLERGLLTIESSENQLLYGILPEIHFFLARSWFSLHQTVTEEYKRALEFSQIQALDRMDSEPDRTEINMSAMKTGSHLLKLTPTELMASTDSTVVYSTTTVAPTGGAPLQPAPVVFENTLNCVPVASWTTYPASGSSSQPGYQPATMFQPPPPIPIPNPVFHPMYHSMGLASDPTIPPGPSNSLYSPMIYFGQQSGHMQFTNAYRSPSAQQPQPVFPPHSQAARFLYATQPTHIPPPYLVTQAAPVHCVQHTFSSPFPGGSGINLHGSGLLPFTPSLPPMQSSLLSQPVFLPPPNPAINSTGTSHFVPQLPSDPLSTSQQSIPSVTAFNMMFQVPPGATTAVAPSEQPTFTSDPSLAASVLSAVSTNGSGSSDSSSTSSSVAFQGVFMPPAFAQLSPSRFVPIAVGPPQASFAQRFASMSNASGSVVVHPASSDRGSTTSETDSSRPTDSVAEGLIEEHPNAACCSLVPSSLDGATTTRVASCNSGSHPVTNTSTIQALEAKSHLYLRRAYLCATSAIKKIFLPQPGSHGSSGAPAGSHSGASPSGRCGRGGKSHHHHQHHGTQQRQRSQPPTDQPSLSATCYSNSDAESVGVGWAGACQLAASDLNRVRLPMSADTQLVKVWDVNILWTLDVASGLGPTAVHEYCNLVLQCVQYPLLMKQITTKVIDYFNNLSSQPATTGSSVQPDHPGNTVPSLPVQSGTSTYPHCSPPKHTELQAMHPAHFYPLTYPTYPYLNGKSAIPPPGTWTMQPTATGHDALSLHSQTNYTAAAAPPPPPYTMPSPMWTPVYGHSSVEAPHLKQGQMNEMFIARFQQIGSSPESLQCNNSGLLLNGQLGQAATRVDAQHPIYGPPSLIAAPNWNTVSQTPVHSTNHNNATQANACNTLSHPVAHDLQTSGRELVERLINRTHALFHKFIDQRLQYIGQGQTEWDDFVDLILKAYNVHLHMPATDCGLHWNQLLTRIRRHHKCGAALWQRILAGIQTADLKRSG